MFKNLDRQSNYNLSQSRYKKDRRQWALNDALNSFYMAFLCIIFTHVHNHLDSYGCLLCWALAICAKESYVLAALMSFARRYWRKAINRGTRTPVAQQLKAVLKPNPRRLRPRCGKKKGRILSIILHIWGSIHQSTADVYIKCWPPFFSWFLSCLDWPHYCTPCLRWAFLGAGFRRRAYAGVTRAIWLMFMSA